MITVQLANALLNQVVRGTPFVVPSAIHLALYTTAPEPDGTGGVEVSGGGYVRRSIRSLMADAADGSIVNASDIAFPTATAPWGDVVAVGLWDSNNGGRLLALHKFSGPRAVAAGQTVGWLAGDFRITWAGEQVGGGVVQYGWHDDLLEVPEHTWHGLVGATPEQASAALYVQDGHLWLDTGLAVAAGASPEWVGEAELVGVELPVPMDVVVRVWREVDADEGGVLAGFKLTVHDGDGVQVHPNGNPNAAFAGMALGRTTYSRNGWGTSWTTSTSSTQGRQCSITLGQYPEVNAGMVYATGNMDFIGGSSGSVGISFNQHSSSPFRAIPNNYRVRARLVVERSAADAGQGVWRFPMFKAVGAQRS